MKTAEYLDLVLKQRAEGVNAQLARLLGVHRAAITNYQTGDRVMDDYTAARVAEVLGIDEIEVIAQANAEREKDPEKRAFWEEKAKTAREKREPLEVVASLGIEPRTRGFSIRCSTN